MNYETLKALYQLDVDEVGEKEAAKRWEIRAGDDWVRLSPPLNCLGHRIRRKPGIPWPILTLHTSPEPLPQTWPADAPEWANYMATDANGGTFLFKEAPKILLDTSEWYRDDGQIEPANVCPNWRDTLIERPKPKEDYCGVCGEWLGGPVECCGKYYLKPPVTKDAAVAVRAARKAVKQKIDWSKLQAGLQEEQLQRVDGCTSGWIAWNCDESTRGNPLPDGLVVEWYYWGHKSPFTSLPKTVIAWDDVVNFRIVGIQEGWE